MLTSQDLRPGNLLKNKSGKIIKVLSVLPEGINYCHGDKRCKFKYSDINPIVLTESLLAKYRFKPFMKQEEGDENETNRHEYNIGGLLFSKFLHDSEFVFCTNDIYDEETFTYTLPSVRYVHQLQNLYFALTRKELIFNTIKE